MPTPYPDSDRETPGETNGDAISETERPWLTALARGAKVERVRPDDEHFAVYEVTSDSGETYEVIPSVGACTCPDATYRNRTCWHYVRAQAAAVDILDGIPFGVTLTDADLDEAVAARENDDETVDALRDGGSTRALPTQTMREKMAAAARADGREDDTDDETEPRLRVDGGCAKTVAHRRVFEDDDGSRTVLHRNQAIQNGTNDRARSGRAVVTDLDAGYDGDQVEVRLITADGEFLDREPLLLAPEDVLAEVTPETHGPGIPVFAY